MKAPQKITGYAPVNGLQMYYEIYGDGELPLVLIHGGGSTIDSCFGYLLPLLPLKYKIIAVELQAHGRTSDREGPETFEQDADDVAGLLRYLSIENAAVLGFSNGGSTAMQMAIRHPLLLTKMVVIAAAYKREGLIPGFFDGLNLARLKDMPAVLQNAYLKVAHNKDQLQTMFEKDKNRMLAFKDWPDEALKSINVPALLIAGDKDVITVAHTLKMSQLIPGARLVILPGEHGACIGSVESLKETKSNNLPGITAALLHEFIEGLDAA